MCSRMQLLGSLFFLMCCFFVQLKTVFYFFLQITEVNRSMRKRRMKKDFKKKGKWLKYKQREKKNPNVQYPLSTSYFVYLRKKQNKLIELFKISRDYQNYGIFLVRNELHHIII